MLYISSGLNLLKVLPGQAFSISTDPNASYQIITAPNATTSALVASAARLENSLIVNYADGTSITMQDYFINCTGENPCRLVLDDQELDILLSLNIEEPIIDQLLRPIVEANIFMTNDSNYSKLLNQSIANNQLINTDFPAGSSSIDIANFNSPIEALGNLVDKGRSSLSIHIADNNLSAGEKTLITFTFNQPPIGFSVADINADNAIISNLTVTGDAKVYTATLTPTAHLLDATNIVTVSASYTDIFGNQGSQSFSANYVINTNYAPIMTGANDTLIYTEGDGAQIIDASLNLSDIDDSLIISASISISNGFNDAEDFLTFVDAGGITGSYDATTGVLDLSGNASINAYQSALQSVTYTNNNNLNPTAGDRTINWKINDGHSDSITATSTINVVPINSVPLLFSGQQQISFDGSNDYLTLPTILENQGLHDSSGNFLGMSIAASVTMDEFNHFDRIIDLSEGGANNDNIYISNKRATSTLRYEIHDGTSSYAVDVQNFFTLGENVDIVINHASDGTVTIYRNGIEIDPNVNTITINNSLAPDPIIIPTPANVTRSTNLIGKSHASGTTYFEGSMDNISLVARTLSEAEITTLASGDYSILNQDSATIFNYAFDGSDPLTDQSTLQNNATAFGSPLTINENVEFIISGGEVTIADNILLSDLDSHSLSTATISLQAGFVSTEDALHFSDTSNITGSYNSSSGVLTLTGSDTLENYQSALRSITYSNSNTINPSTVERVISLTINDGIDDSLAVNTYINIANNVVPQLFIGQTSMVFDGVNDYLVVPDISVYDSNGDFLGMSIAATFTMDALTNYSRITDFSAGGGNNYNIFAGAVGNTTTLRYKVQIGSNAGDVIEVENFFTLGIQTSIVINHASDGTVTIYKNGVAIAPSTEAVTVNGVATTTTLNINTPDNILLTDNYIGNAHWGNGLFNGTIDNLAMLTRILTTAEIDNFANGYYSEINQDSATLFNYSFAGSNPLTDQSTLQNNATAFGSPLTINGNIDFIVSGDAVIIAENILLSDLDSHSLSTATISLQAGFISTEDALHFSDTSNITGSYNSSSGVLTLTGSDTLENYQSALRSITYSNSNTINPSTVERVISLTINDGIDDSLAVNTYINIANNVVPQLFIGQTSMVFDGVNDYLVVPDISVYDSNGDFLGMSIAATFTMDALTNYSRITDFSAGGGNNYNIFAGAVGNTTTLRYKVQIGSNAGDVIEVENFFTLGIQTSIVINHASDGTVTIYKNGVAIDPSTESVTVNGFATTTTLNINNPDNILLTDNLIGNAHWGNGLFNGTIDNLAMLTRILTTAEIDNFANGDYSAINQDSTTLFNYAFDGSDSLTDQSISENHATAFGTPLILEDSASFTVGGTAVVISGDILLVDTFSHDFISATISISDNFNSAQDLLAFANTTNITGNYDTSTGILSLTGSASTDEYQDALRSVTYTNINNINPDIAYRTINWQVNDGIDNSLPVTTTVQLLAMSYEITLTANQTGSSISGFSGSLQATLTDNYDYQPLDPILSSPNYNYQPTDVGFHSVEGPGVDAILNYDLNTLYTQGSNNSFVIDLYGRDRFNTTDDNFDILLFDNNGALLGSIENLALPDTSTPHLRVNVSDLLSSPLVNGDTIGAFRIIAHDSTTSNPNNYFTLMEIRAADIINISSEVTLTANLNGSSLGSQEATLTDTFDYQPLNPIASLPDQLYLSSSSGFHGVESDGVDVILNYDLNTPYTQFSNENAFVIDLYGRDNYHTTDDDFDILIFDLDGALLGSIEHLALPDTATSHLRVNVSELLSPALADGKTIAAFRIIAHDTTTTHPNNYFTLMEIRAAELNLVTPIILDLDGDGIETTTLQAGVIFDIDGDGHKEQSAWVGANDALLVRDINGDGQVNDASELFGGATILANGSTASDGYAALADLDSNNDDVINAFDTLFNELQIWQDKNSDAVIQEGELTYLKDSNVAQLNLLATDSNEWQNSNLIGKQSLWTDTSGDTHDMADVWLGYSALDEGALNQLSIDLSTDANSEDLLLAQEISQIEAVIATSLINDNYTIQETIDTTATVIDNSDDEALRSASIVL